MIKFMNMECITEKEASTRYGYTEFWFRKMRKIKQGPPFFQIKKKGKVFYPIADCDAWFKKKREEKE